MTDKPKSSTMFVFIIATLVFFYFKYSAIFSKGNKTVPNFISGFTFFSETAGLFIIYVVLIIGYQFFEGTRILTSTCGAPNYLQVFRRVIIPWVFIFIVMAIMLNVFPGLKRAFTDVIGYAFVANKLNTILAAVVFPSEKQKDAFTSLTDEDKRKKLAFDTLKKINETPGILTSAITPTNFNDMWNVLVTLAPDINALNEQKFAIFQYQVIRDFIGEFFWYIYTGILVVTTVNTSITTYKCVKTPQQINEELVENSLLK